MNALNLETILSIVVMPDLKVIMKAFVVHCLLHNGDLVISWFKLNTLKLQAASTLDSLDFLCSRLIEQNILCS